MQPKVSIFRAENKEEEESEIGDQGEAGDQGARANGDPIISSHLLGVF